jgi:hypothetical protein
MSVRRKSRRAMVAPTSSRVLAKFIGAIGTSAERMGGGTGICRGLERVGVVQNAKSIHAAALLWNSTRSIVERELLEAQSEQVLRFQAACAHQEENFALDVIDVG